MTAYIVDLNMFGQNKNITQVLERLSSTYDSCDNFVEFLHTRLCINSTRCVIPWLARGNHKHVHRSCSTLHNLIHAFCSSFGGSTGSATPFPIGQAASLIDLA